MINNYNMSSGEYIEIVKNFETLKSDFKKINEGLDSINNSCNNISTSYDNRNILTSYDNRYIIKPIIIP